MIVLPLGIICLVDIVGSLGMMVFGSLAFRKALAAHRLDPNNPRYSYLCWVCGTLMVFAFVRGGGHILRYVLLALHEAPLWFAISPYIGALNTLSFMLIVGVTLFMRDVERICLRLNKEREKLEHMSREILELNRDLEQIVSERTISELALRIAHRVRNPVMVIGGLIRRLAKECPQNEKLDQKFRLILEQVERLEEIVREFEGLMESQSDLFRTEDLNRIVHSAVNLVLPEAEEKGIVIETRYGRGPLLFRGHGQLIKVALVHVLRNAIEACRRGDRIQVETGLEKGEAYVIVRDTGPGIPPEIMDHIFKPFYSTKGRRTGLGLPYVKQIIEEHRGRIEIHSEPGRGTTVKIFLPVYFDARPE
ncbi:MAG: HAMP domain-containing histidine kinase [Thermodesulfobacteria bacterium]|nr:HAMP domain-containing histidine kinase [Thermodesulfobacteriota bacterium]